MDCQFCFGPDKGDREITEEKGKKVIDEVISSGVKKIVFTGGEPLLCSYIYSLLKYAKDKGLFVILHTNGLLLNWDIIKKLETLIDQINLPLDGYDEETNSKMRLPGHFKKIIKILTLLKKSPIRVIISTVVTSKNKYFISNISNILPEFIYKWRIFQFKAEGKSKKFEKELRISDKEFIEIKKEVESKNFKFRTQFVNNSDKKFENSFYII
jgi:MoaA/NifB/PqqE/SkfB family radical SAM enzyme